MQVFSQAEGQGGDRARRSTRNGPLYVRQTDLGGDRGDIQAREDSGAGEHLRQGGEEGRGRAAAEGREAIRASVCSSRMGHGNQASAAHLQAPSVNRRGAEQHSWAAHRQLAAREGRAGRVLRRRLRDDRAGQARRAC